MEVPMSRRCWPGVFAAAALASLASANPIDVPVFTWTPLAPSPDSRIVFVSSSAGSDLNSGLSEAAPVQSLARGVSLLRDGWPDWLVLRAGDAWDETLGVWTLSGRSGAEPMVVGTFGTGARPLLRTGDAPALRHVGATPLAHLAFVGLDFHAHARDPRSPAFSSTKPVPGIEWLGASKNILFEDLAVRYYKDNFSIQSLAGARPSNVRVRGCVITDAYAVDAHAQGLYAAGVSGLLVEGCVFDRNGWNDLVAGAQPTIYNHNIYLLGGENAGPCAAPVIRNNVLANASSFGVKLAANAPGTQIAPRVEFNLFVRCGNGLEMGSADFGVAGAVVRHNVFTEIGREFAAHGPQSLGIEAISLDGAAIEGNVFAHKGESGGSASVSLGSTRPYRAAAVRRNAVFNWHAGKISISGADAQGVTVIDNALVSLAFDTPLQVLASAAPGVAYQGNCYFRAQGSSAWFLLEGVPVPLDQWTAATGEAGAEVVAGEVFPDPYRDLASYHALIGGTPNVEGFITRAREQSKATWNPGYSAARVVAYFAEGFGIDDDTGGM
jgi:hypothetical protein